MIDEAERQGIPVRYAERRDLDAMAHGATHGGLLAVCTAKPRMPVDKLIAHLDKLDEPPLLLLLEGVEDARNLGFVIRSAEAVGVHAVLVKKHLWDLDPVEVARSASGAYENMPLVQVEDVQPIKALQARGLHLIGCIAGVRRTCYQADLRQPTILALGGEKRGLSSAVRDLCDRFVTIPTRPGAPSLSLSHAAAILMGEAMRQRLPQDETAGSAGGESVAVVEGRDAEDDG